MKIKGFGISTIKNGSTMKYRISAMKSALLCILITFNLAAGFGDETFKLSLDLERIDLDSLETRSLRVAVEQADFHKMETIRNQLGKGILIWKFNDAVSQEKLVWISRNETGKYSDDIIYGLEEDVFSQAYEFSQQAVRSSPRFIQRVSDNSQYLIIFLFDDVSVASGIFVDGVEKLRYLNRGEIQLSPLDSGSLVSFGSLISFLFSYSDIISETGIRFESREDIVMTSNEIRIIRFLRTKSSEEQMYFRVLEAFDHDYRTNGLPDIEP